MFLFGFLSSMLPYAATLVVMGLYFLLGTPKHQEETLSDFNLKTSIEQHHNDVVKKGDITFAGAKCFSIPKNETLSTFLLTKKEKKKSSTTPTKHYQSVIRGALCNKAPPVLA